MSDLVTVTLVTRGDVATLLPMFTAYRGFYGKKSDSPVWTFLRDRVTRGESVTYIATRGTGAVGFVQLCPTFSSVSMTRIQILNDLFVVTEARGRGVASMLIASAVNRARSNGHAGLTVQTARDNDAAQRVYERARWFPDDPLVHHNIRVPETGGEGLQ